MMIIGISFVTKKNIPTIKITKQKIDSEVEVNEMEESILRSHHVVNEFDNQYNSQVEWSEDPKIKERDLLD